MGRKKRNPRPYRASQTFASVQEARQESIIFDLSQGKSWGKIYTSRGRSAIRYDVFVGIGKPDPEISALYRLGISVSEDIKRKLGEFMIVRRILQDGAERLYLLKADPAVGYKLSKQNGSRWRAQITIHAEDVGIFEDYEGGHDIKWDEPNDAYYIIKN